MSTVLNSGGSTDGGGNAGAGGDGGAGAGAGAAAGGAGTANAGGAGAGGGASGGGGGSTGGSAASWRDALPEDIRSNPAIASFTDVVSLAKSHIHAQSTIGKKGAIVPGEKSTPEEWQAFYKAIGVPEADKYQVAPPKDTKIPENFMKDFQANAQKMGLLPKQAEGLLGWYLGVESAQHKAIAQASSEAQATGLKKLQEEWGDAYKTKVQAAQAAIHTLPKDMQMLFDHPSVGNNPGIVKLMAHVASWLSEDKLREGGMPAGEGSQTPGEIQAELAELRARGRENGLYDKSHPMHNVTLAKMESLAKRLTGGK